MSSRISARSGERRATGALRGLAAAGIVLAVAVPLAACSSSGSNKSGTTPSATSSIVPTRWWSNTAVTAGSTIVVLAPLVAPIGAAYGIDPVHLGVVFLANLELGFLFPPMGLNLFLSASRFHKPLPYLYARTFPFLCILAGGVLLITYLDPITTGVVRLLAR